MKDNSSTSSEIIVLENILRDRLLNLHKEKTKEELLDIVIQNEIQMIRYEKEIENLKFLFYKSKQTDAEEEKNNTKTKRAGAKGVAKKGEAIEKLIELKPENDSFIKDELSIYDYNYDYDQAEELLLTTYFSSTPMSKNNDSNIKPSELIRDIKEIKENLKNFYSHNLNVEFNNDEIQDFQEDIKIIKNYTVNLDKVTSNYKKLLVDYSNQILTNLENLLIKPVDYYLNRNNTPINSNYLNYASNYNY